MPQYMILIYDDEAAIAAASPDEFAELLAEHGKFMQNNAAVLRGGSAVQPSSTATTIRTNGSGEPRVESGPWLQAKHSLGGYYLVEAADLDAALDIGKQVPARFGGIEVRPLLTFN